VHPPLLILLLWYWIEAFGKKPKLADKLLRCSGIRVTNTLRLAGNCYDRVLETT
jgi:hypothetical protein